MFKDNEAVLVLSSGKIFNGLSLGHIGKTVGEVCFNTGMTGYQEILTDPSYHKQIVTMTFPHMGNYGITSNDSESQNIQVSGLVIKEETKIPSNWRSSLSLGDFLKTEKTVGIKNVDTRSITRHIRDNGSMNGIISSDNFDVDYLKEHLSEVPLMDGLDLVTSITTKTPFYFLNKRKLKYKIAVINYGVKEKILELFNSLNCELLVFPADVSYNKILEYNPDGVFLSNGPGDPAAVKYGIDLVKSILGNYPVFGICLGHQILALALGAKTYKLKFGHRGLNHPVKNLSNNTIEITSQNHGFVVSLENLPDNIKVTHLNLNDNTLAGLECDEFSSFSVQYHPESSPGPHDSRYLFKKFIDIFDAQKR